jgi:hypothetical protein
MSVFQVVSFILFSSSIAGIVYSKKISDYLVEKNWLGFNKNQSKDYLISKVRTTAIVGSIIFGILMSNNWQFIIGLIIVGIGYITLRYSVPIHRLLAETGLGNTPWFRGDNAVKLAGVVMMIAGALWMSGVTQAIFLGIFRFGGIA